MTRPVAPKALLALAAIGLCTQGIAADRDASGAEPFRPAFHACIKASGGVTAALNDCIGTEHDYQDKRLNTAYQSLRKTLSEPQRLSLRAEEMAWITSRDKRCAPDPDGGTGSMLDSNQCALRETAERAVALEARTARH